MGEDQGDSGCAFVRLSVHNDTPTIDIGSVWIAAYPLPWIAFVTLYAVRVSKVRKLQSSQELKDAAKAERALSPARHSQLWTAPNLGWELLRISAFIGPIVACYCLVDFTSSCMTWRWVLSGLSATPPSLDGGGLFGGMAFLVTWIVASYPRDPIRPQRPPMETLRQESWFCARAAERSLAYLIAFWMFAWALSQLMGIELACSMFQLLVNSSACQNRA